MSLPIAHFVALEPSFHFQYPVCSVFCWSLRRFSGSSLVSVTQLRLPLLFPFFSSQTLALSSLRFPFLCPFFCHVLSGMLGRKCLLFPPSPRSGCVDSLIPHAFLGMARLKSGPSEGCCSGRPRSRVVSPLVISNERQ